jgi:hypothetical protein
MQPFESSNDPGEMMLVFEVPDADDPGLVALFSMPAAEAVWAYELQFSSQGLVQLRLSSHHKYPAEGMQPCSSLSPLTACAKTHSSSQVRRHLLFPSHHTYPAEGMHPWGSLAAPSRPALEQFSSQSLRHFCFSSHHTYPAALRQPFELGLGPAVGAWLFPRFPERTAIMMTASAIPINASTVVNFGLPPISKAADFLIAFFAMSCPLPLQRHCL